MFDLKEARVASQLDLFSDMGQSLRVLDVTMAWDGEGRRVQSVTLTFRVSWSDWQRIDGSAWFHLTADVRGPIFGGRLKPDKDVWIEAALDPSRRRLVCHKGVSDIIDAAAEIVAAGATSDLVRVSSWYATHVTQELRPGLRMGFSTSWNEPGALPRREPVSSPWGVVPI